MRTDCDTLCNNEMKIQNDVTLSYQVNLGGLSPSCCYNAAAQRPGLSFRVTSGYECPLCIPTALVYPGHHLGFLYQHPQ